MQPFTYSVDRPHAESLDTSTGYIDSASAFFPLGKLIRAASHTKPAEAAQATSRVLTQWNFHVSRFAAGRVDGSPATSFPRIATVLSLPLATCNCCCSLAVSTSAGFTSSPE